MPKKPPAPSRSRRRPRRAQEVHSSNRWRCHSERLRRQFPLCTAPFCEGRKRGAWPASTSVHHIEPVARRPDLAFDDSNTAPVCWDCHSRVEGMERAGQATAHLFDGWQENV